MNLKEKIARLSELKRDAERADCELLGYSNAEEVEDRLRSAVKTFKDEADDMFEIIQKQQEIINHLEFKLRRISKIKPDHIESYCLSVRDEVHEALEKTKQLMEG